ncbi:hypothetical protein HY612_04300 [Candidatus Roizmanbacteria bacterium]|nr:hypothetical protein [Candidatus Roizmanbacteria bacterium]
MTDNYLSREQLEAMIVTSIKKSLEHKEMSGERAQQIAKIVLDLIPEDITHEQLISIIPHLDDQISELAGLVQEILKVHDEKLKAEVLPKIRNMINSYSVKQG